MDQKENKEELKQEEVVQKAPNIFQSIAVSANKVIVGLLHAAVDVSNDVIGINSKDGLDLYEKRAKREEN